MNMVKKVGSKLDSKLKSGEIKESELMEEASQLMEKMKNMPGANWTLKQRDFAAVKFSFALLKPIDWNKIEEDNYKNHGYNLK